MASPNGKKVSHFLFALLFITVLHSSFIVAHANDDRPHLKIMTIPLPPWGYKLPNRSPAGICYEWANAIAERMGRKSDNKIVPMARLFKAIEYGRTDFSIMLRTPYSEKISVPISYVKVPFKTVVWPRKGVTIENYEQLREVKISMARGLKVGGDFAKEQERLNINLSMDYAHSMQMFQAGRADAVIGTLQSLRYNAFKVGMNPDEEFGEPFVISSLEGWVQASKSFIAREGMNELKKATDSLIADGTFARIYDKYTQSMTTLAN